MKNLMYGETMLPSELSRSGCGSGRCLARFPWTRPRGDRYRQLNAAALAADAVGVFADPRRGSSSNAVRRLAVDSLLTRASAVAVDQRVEGASPT